MDVGLNQICVEMSWKDLDSEKKYIEVVMETGFFYDYLVINWSKASKSYGFISTIGI